ncbi:hypothetical protein FSARC_8387 [Fusarium sarcochroum]|uniref:Uncharacterized protein n=1 Tax=Fusarium sarcochroum TaxID=1208366 RepID=A0A8H4X6C1_9HYPO|nr:hypothetical protein FSARC_8387 [Fusarium sarcochroum]
MVKNGQPGQEFCTPQEAATALRSDRDRNHQGGLVLSGEVMMGKYGTGSGTDRLWTSGLATCVRIAVTGDYSVQGSNNNNKDRFLAHVDEEGRDEALQGLINSVMAAKARGLVNLKATVFALDPQKDGGTGDSLQDEFNEKVTDSIEALIGRKPKMEWHSQHVDGKLSIESNKQIVPGADV